MLRTLLLAGSLLAASAGAALATGPDNYVCTIKRQDGAKLEYWFDPGPMTAKEYDRFTMSEFLYRRDGKEWRARERKVWAASKTPLAYEFQPTSDRSWFLVVDRTTKDKAQPAELWHNRRLIGTGHCGWDGSFIDAGE